ncbi:MAG: PorV/PorQ family protein [Candidatus Latescibacteria bacterium]|nr:PorV/PorQ family protein [Candidatus Latescibacterota bacterium]
MLGLILSLIIFNVDPNPNAGATGYTFLRISPSARTAAMANTSIGLETNPDIAGFDFLYNPATDIINSNLSLGYINYLAGISLGALGYGQANPLPFLSSGGVGITYLNSGLIKRTDEQGNELGTFTVSYLNLNAVGSRTLMNDQMTVGAGLKFLYGSIDSFVGLGSALDIGLRYKANPNFLVGAVVKNLGLEFKAFDTDKDDLPLDIGVGASYLVSKSIVLALDIHKPTDNSVLFNFGGQAALNDYIVLRAGYNSSGKYYKTGGAADILSGLSAGLGVKYSKYQLDYSFTPMGDLGRLHHISLSLVL